MIKAKLRFTKEYENTYKRVGANITIIRNGCQYFFRMFDSDLSPQELRNRYGWQACKKISIESNATTVELLKKILRNMKDVSEVIRINKIRYILIYFNNENEINAIYKSGMEDDMGLGIQLKSQDELIGKDGSLG
ncbi:hypothetical protein RhiirA4_428672 [Rhizophagus irregularis]|uniref:Uncharacterized protein n=1 Tax=Rhizophagus irregularis TaxID=588596 RepID=A0A2I1HDQ0_9GLOM|nr:hypothetical protein RhiirA4_428672 [Rhizophagus irregularis]